MNRIGMIVDVSHVADTTMAAALDVSKAPVMASHSSARALADRPRNIPDALLARIGAAGGVVMVNFYPAFLSSEVERLGQCAHRLCQIARACRPRPMAAKAPASLAAWERDHPMPRVGVREVADHVEHVAKVAGKGAVGFGGDYDGIGGTGAGGDVGGRQLSAGTRRTGAARVERRRPRRADLGQHPARDGAGRGGGGEHEGAAAGRRDRAGLGSAMRPRGDVRAMGWSEAT